MIAVALADLIGASALIVCSVGVGVWAVVGERRDGGSGAVALGLDDGEDER